MGSGVVDVKSADETRAKEFPAIARIKAMLKKVIERDRTKTAEEFKGKIADGVDYVLNLNDFIKGANTTESKANLAQFKLLNDKLKVSDKLWNTLTNKDTVQVIGDLEAVKKALEDETHKGSAKWWINDVLTNLEQSEANVIGLIPKIGSKTKPSTVQDIIQAELDKVREKMLAEHRNGFTYKYPEIGLEENYKVETDIIVPTETFQKNVNRKIECKE